MDMPNAFLCGCLFLLTACKEIPEPGTARLRITQLQTRCCYMEGQVSFLEVNGPSGSLQREFIAEDLVQPVIDRELLPGLYVVRSWQRPCAGNCSSLDPVANACTASFVLEPGRTTFVTATFTPGDEDCALAETSTAPPSSVPDAIAMRADFPTCDYAYYLYPDRRPESPQLNCFITAHQAGEEAEMTGSLPAATGPDAHVRAIFRTHSDRRLEVFRRAQPGFDSPWLHYTCAGFTADGLFRPDTVVPQDCTEPAAL